MDLEIQKSLVNKDVNSNVHNPAIAINKTKKNIKEKVQNLLNSSEKVDIAVSYVVWSGLSLIQNNLSQFNENSRIIVTTEGFVTDPRSLKTLMNLPMQAKVYAPSSGAPGFHLKTYLGSKNNESKLLVGSSNISSRAFGSVYEMAIEVRANHSGMIIQEYNDTFEDIWNNEYSILITQEFIDNYRLEYKKTKELSKKIANFRLDNEIKPNYMQIKT